MEAWHAELKADPEVGPAFTENLAKVKNFVRRLAGEDKQDLVDFFDQSGYGSHPPLVRLFLRAANLISEDALPGTSGDKPGGDKGDTLTEQEKLRRAYPSMFDKDGTPKNAGVTT